LKSPSPDTNKPKFSPSVVPEIVNPLIPSSSARENTELSCAVSVLTVVVAAAAASWEVTVGEVAAAAASWEVTVGEVTVAADCLKVTVVVATALVLL